MPDDTDSLYDPLFSDIAPRKDISPLAKILYGAIYSLARKQGHCHATNSFLAKKLGVSPRWISKQLAVLIEKKLVIITPDAKRRKLSTLHNAPHTDKKKETRNNSSRGVEQSFQGGRTIVPPNNKYNNINNKYIYARDYTPQVNTTNKTSSLRKWKYIPQKQKERPQWIVDIIQRTMEILRQNRYKCNALTTTYA